MSPASRHMHLSPFGSAPGQGRSERYASYTHEPPR